MDCSEEEKFEDIRIKYCLNKNIYDIIKEEFKYDSKLPIQNKTNNVFKQITLFVENKFIVTMFQPPQIYRVKYISFDKNPTNTIIKDNNNNNCYLISKYYEIFFQHKVNFPFQPLLICEKIFWSISNEQCCVKQKQKLKQENVYLPCEFCYFIDYNSIIGNHPLQNIETNNNGNSNTTNKCTLDTKNKKEKNRGINEDISDEDDESILYSDYNEEYNNIFSFFGKYINITQNEENFVSIHFENNNYFNLNENKFFQSKLQYKKWCVFYPTTLGIKAQSIISHILNTAKFYSVFADIPEKISFSEDENGDYLILESLDKFFNENNPLKYSIILIVMENKKSSLYENAKKLCIEKFGLVTQFILCEKSKSSNITYYNSILLQMLAKTGSELYRINFHEVIKNPKDYMILGVFFIAENGNNTIQIVFVSSYNEHFNNYHLKHIKIVNNLHNIQKGVNECIDDAIENFSMINGYIPEEFIAYIDGDKMGNEIALNFSLIISKIKNCFILMKKKFCLISPFFSCNLKKEEDSSVFSLNKHKLKEKLFFIYENRSRLTIHMLMNITLKLTYYYWNNYNSLKIPSCLKYAEIGLKAIKKNNLISIKGRLLNEPFYL